MAAARSPAMRITIDTHCHSVASGHAYSSIDELAREARKKRLKLIALTDHSPAMPGAAHLYYFHNLRILPETIAGVRVLKGAEVNILTDGSLDLDDRSLEQLEIAIASLHIPCVKPSDKDTHTALLCNVMKNPYINTIGHLGDTRYDFDIAAVVAAAKSSGTLIEINNSSLKPETFRPGGDTMIAEILAECARQKAAVIFGSDAHYRDALGVFDECRALATKLAFPEELVVRTPEQLLERIKYKRDRK